MKDIQSLLQRAKTLKATDIHIIAGSPVMARVDGELTAMGKTRLTRQESQRLCYTFLNKAEIEAFERIRDMDTMISDEEHCRYRVNISYNSGDVGGVIRLLPSSPMPLEKLRLPKLVAAMTQARKGMILLTGSTSQGKSTTMAGMVDYINQRFRKHIVTIEDPIEYVHTSKHSIIRQRDVGHDTESFYSALRAALRQDPNVIVIGEMRDYETIKIALTAAETGVLVISSMHVITLDKIIERLLSYAPDGSDGHMRALLAESLLGVIHQELLPTIDGGKRVACETLVVTDAVRNVLRGGASFQLRNIVATGSRYGMQTMKSSLDALLAEGVIAESTYESVLAHYA